ncbi:hypothetical protein FHX12_002784 [Rhizobium sp. BK609]|nr:hypothetical protein [Rhizobium sp. BK098]MBB3615803.1 hypothetical protein [Rhizobium sp. BK609]MBB3681461.1 hypothetical protein [Rhizobium sp. BK612]
MWMPGRLLFVAGRCLTITEPAYYIWSSLDPADGDTFVIVIEFTQP